jgi:hypothetical protein
MIDLRTFKLSRVESIAFPFLYFKMINAKMLFAVFMEGSQTLAQESSSDEEDVREVPQEIANIPECKGISRRMWSTKIVVLFNETRLPVVEGICELQSRHRGGWFLRRFSCSCPNLEELAS